MKPANSYPKETSTHSYDLKMLSVVEITVNKQPTFNNCEVIEGGQR
jgi:hypothetical protein